jgi:hypothetical protein
MTDTLQKVDDVVNSSKGFLARVKDKFVAYEEEIANFVRKVADYENEIFNLTNEKNALVKLLEVVELKLKEVEDVVAYDFGATVVANTETEVVAPEVVAPVVDVPAVVSVDLPSTSPDEVDHNHDYMDHVEVANNEAVVVPVPVEDNVPVTIIPFAG